MGPPYLDKNRLYDFFVEYKKEATRETGRFPTDFSTRVKPVSMINKISGLWTSKLSDDVAGLRPNKTRPKQDPSLPRITNHQIESHVVAFFTRGVLAEEELGLLRAPELVSDLQFMQDDNKAYDFFLFWLDQSNNEWLDAFLFEIADQWQDVMRAQEKNQALSEAVLGLRSSSRFSTDNLRGLLKSGTLGNHDQNKLMELISDLNHQENIIRDIENNIYTLVDGLRTPDLMRTEGAQMTAEFFSNGFLMRRVKENKNNIRSVRYALRELELGNDK
jgi:hypothetical protein